MRACWPGVVAAVQVAPASASGLEVAPEVLGDRNSWSPLRREQMAPAGIAFLTPYRKRQDDPDPDGSRVLTRVRWRVETAAAQFVKRYHLKRHWARDTWHLTSRMLRKGLRYTLADFLCLAVCGDAR